MHWGYFDAARKPLLTIESGELISKRAGISREDAYSLCSLAADLRVTQIVNGSKGIHAMIEKKYLAPARM